MKKLLKNFMFMITLSIVSFAQSDWCGTVYSPDPSPNQKSILSLGGLVDIPVFFHVIYHSNGTGNVSKSQIDDQIDVLNSSYSSSEFSFYLAGISRTESDSWHTPGSKYLDDIVNTLSIDPVHALNVYICNIPGYGFVLYFPWEKPASDKNHGVFVDYTTLPGGSATDHNDGKTTVHEVGHFLGLYHTFENECSSPGDYVNDTPYHTVNTGCPPSTTDTCPTQPDNDPVNNYMNYVNDPCMYEFTNGQINRMYTQVAAYKTDIGGSVINFTSDFVINSNQSLDLYSGITLKFSSGKYINNSGILKVNGNSNNRITFISQSGSWDGIRFYSGSSGTIDYATINNATYGVYVSGATPVIKNSNFSDNSYGLYINNSYSFSWTVNSILNNTFEDNSSYGVYLYNSSPTLKGNYFTGNGNALALVIGCNPLITNNDISSNTYYGLGCFSSSSPVMYYHHMRSTGGYNEIRNNGNPEIKITGSSNPLLGNSMYNGNNSIVDASGTLILNQTTNTISAENNWWGSSSGPSAGQFTGSVDYNPYLTSDPNAAIKGPQDPNNNLATTKGLNDALSAFFNADYSNAAALFKDYISNNPTDPQIVIFIQYYLFSLDQSVSRSNAISEFSQLKNIAFTDKVGADISGLYSALLERNGNYNEALTELNEGITTKATAENKNQLNLQKAHLLIHSLQNKEKGKEILRQILNEENKDSYLYEIAYYELETLNSESGNSKNNNLISTIEDEQPVDYELANNYPNPFNPSTMIRFSIPQQEKVQLHVYDILGRHVAEVVNETLSAGKYNVDFDGSKLTSGMYIYKLDAGTFTESKKMLLVK